MEKLPKYFCDEQFHKFKRKTNEEETNLHKGGHLEMKDKRK